MKFTSRNYYGFDHKVVNEKFEGGLTYVNDFQLKGLQGGSVTAAVYHCAKPNKAKGHKEYVLLFSSYDPFTQKSQFYVSGRTAEQMHQERMANGIYCPKCDTVLVSIARHDFTTCKCGNFMDGGQHDYHRYGGKDLKDLVHVRVNLLTNKVTKKAGKYDAPKSKRKASPVAGRR